ncbi:MAG: VanZ family protein [Promethearchaeota archaeon]
MKRESNKWVLINYIRIIPAIVIAVVIFYFSSIPNPLPPPPPSEPAIELDVNTLLHMAEFGLLSFLVAFGFRDKANDFMLVFLTILYAVLDEIHQYFVPNRFFDLYDITIDAIGVILGFLAFIITQLLYQKYSNEEKIIPAEEIQSSNI